LNEALISEWDCARCKQAMVTVAWLAPGPTGSTHLRFCRGPVGCGHSHLSTSVVGAEQEDFLDFPEAVWAELCLGTLPAALRPEDVDAISAHSHRASGAYTDAAKKALLLARQGR